MTKPFLTAAWRYLVMLNYEIDPALLQPFVPQGTELDGWNGRIYASIVGFLFQNTRLLGIPIPGHTDFEEVNLRFYVRRRGPEGWRRGVVFIKELVPRRAIATIARVVYNENYQALPMRHQIVAVDGKQYPVNNVQSAVKNGVVAEGDRLQITYEWQFRGRWQGVQAVTQGALAPIEEGSEAEFITEHYWGYAAQRNGGTVEYQVEHPRWRVWSASSYRFDCDVAELYGSQFVVPLSQTPASAFIADGSAVIVRKGQRIVDNYN
jgi:uncharacterized protein